MASESFEKLKSYLRDIFQYNENDLDFGIYKILKLKRNEIESFIEGEEIGCLQKIVEETLTESQSDVKNIYYQSIKNFIEQDVPPRKQKSFLSNINTSLAELKGIAEEAKPENLTEVLKAIDAIQSFEPDTTNEDQIYNYILNFFELYFNNGDFGYNDRSLAQFKIEYDEDYAGSDVMFHWKHKDSYYIKSANDFTNVTFEINGKRLEYRVEGFDTANGTAQNDNKENKLKHYKFIEIKKYKGTHQVIFKLSDKSTPKDEVYSKILIEVFDIENSLKYLFKKDEKPIFNDLIEKYDKILNGQVQGLKSLKLDPEKFYEHLAERDEFRDLGSNKTKRVEELKNDETANVLLLLDKNLNKFYIGNDSDFFIHKDLKKFLTREKEKFIKNVIYSNIDVLLEIDKYEQTRRIARSFNTVVDKIIEFLDAIETFQRNLFTMKKKVLQTDYLISVVKIPLEFHEEILANEEQVKEFRETFNINLDDRLFKLELYPTLVIDTKYFSEDFKERLLAHSNFENIDQQVTGILFNSDNLQALSLIKEKYRGRINCVYIDPPYNTGSDEFLYKDSFRHSSWCSFMNDRLELGKEFLTDDNGSFFISIDDNELDNLLEITQKLFSNEQDNFVNLICLKSGRDEGVKMTHKDKRLVKFKEYILFLAKDKSNLRINPIYKMKFEWDDRYKYWLEKNNSEDVKNWIILPLDNKIKEEGLSFADDEELLEWKIKNSECIIRTASSDSEEIKATKNSDKIIPLTTPKGLQVYAYNGEKILFASNKVKRIDDEDVLGEYVGDLWDDISYNNLHNEGDISLKNGKKPLGLLNRIIDLSNTRDGIILDYFAGSGTTGHSTLIQNRDLNLNNKFILIESENYFDSKLILRLKKMMFSEYWTRGKPNLNNIKGFSTIIKYQTIEQYEDILNNLKSDDERLPQNTPLKYLFRLQEKAVRSTLDLAKPFENKIIYGKENTEGNVDVCETYIYLKGYKVNSIKTYHNSRKKYKVYHTPNRLVIWRNIKEDEDDSIFIKELIAKYEDITSIDVNYHLDKRKIKPPKPYIITNTDFDVNANWS